MAFRFEVFIPRTGEWIVEDEHFDIIGERRVSLKRYERGMLRTRPSLRTRKYRITEFDAPRQKPGVSLQVPGLQELGQKLFG